jgi:hypothetical protein
MEPEKDSDFEKRRLLERHYRGRPWLFLQPVRGTALLLLLGERASSVAVGGDRWGSF